MSDVATHDTRAPDGSYLSLGMGMAFFLPLFLGGSQVAAALRYPELGTAVLFLPYAALVAALVASARKDWKWYVLAAVVAHAVTSLPHWPLSWVLFADVANIARALTAAVLLQRLAGGIPRLDRMRGLAEFLAIAVFIAPAVGATIGAANVVWHVASASYWLAWLSWFSASALTGMIMLPGLLVAARYAVARRPVRISRRRLLEALSLGIALGATCTAAFILHIAAPGDLTLLLFAPSPLLIWAALRFGHGGASVALTVVAGSAIWAADRDVGRFLSLSPDNDVLALQLFLLVTALPLLCVATIGAAGRAALQLHRALLASIQDHVAILDASGVVLEANQSWQRFAKAPHYCDIDRILEGDDFPAVCHAVTLLPPEHPISELGRAKAARILGGVGDVLSGATRRFEMEYEQCEGGPHQWFSLRIEALERADGGVVVTRADISSRHQAQLDVEEQRREVTHLARIGMLGQLSGALAHELRQPLASILANAESAQLLMQREPLDVDELRAVVREIVSEDRHAAKVIEGLRSMLKRGEARVRAVEMEPIVSAVLAMMRHELVTRGVAVTVSVPRDLPAVLADAVQLQQVLLNLMLNACEALHDAAPGSRAIQLTASARGERTVRISVRDCGAGFPQALAVRLFEPFVTTKPDGLGLGLSISRAIIASHGGRIWTENPADGGAVVHCELPTAVANEYNLQSALLEAMMPA